MEDEQDEGPTIEDILSAVIKTKSKFGMVNVPFPVRRRLPRMSGKTPASSQENLNATDKNVPHQSNTLGQKSGETQNGFLDNRMSRSVSTPEVREKNQLEQHDSERSWKLRLKNRDECSSTDLEGCVKKPISPKLSRHSDVENNDPNLELLYGPSRSAVKTSRNFPNFLPLCSHPEIDTLQSEEYSSTNSTSEDSKGSLPVVELQNCAAAKNSAHMKWKSGRMSEEVVSGSSSLRISPTYQNSTYPSGKASLSSTKKLAFKNNIDSSTFQTSTLQSANGTSASRSLDFCSKMDRYSSGHQRNKNPSNTSVSGNRVISTTPQSLHAGSRTGTPFSNQVSKVIPAVERIGSTPSQNLASAQRLYPNNSESRTGNTSYENVASARKMNPVMLEGSSSHTSENVASQNENSTATSKSSCSENRTGTAVSKSCTSADRSITAICKTKSSQSRTETASSQKLSSRTNSDSVAPRLDPKFQTPSDTRIKGSEDSWSRTSLLESKLGEPDFFVKGNGYMKLSTLGKGGSSVVYEVLNIETKKVRALKVVDLSKDDEATLQGYKNEIAILERLHWSDRVISLYEYEQTPTQLKMVLEKGSGDLASLLNNHHGKEKSTVLSPFTIQHYWQAMLQAVQAIHKEGIIHSDLKPANFLLVCTTVKLIDFGIASSIQQDMTSVIKDSQAGTFNYMSPESLMDVHTGPIISGKAGNKPVIKIGVKSDVWSLGCILYNMVYGRTPFQHIANPFMKLSAISNPDTKISFPDIENKLLLDTLKKCLQFDPKARPSIEELLEHPYLNQDVKEKDEAASSPSKGGLSSVIQQLQSLTPNSLSKVSLLMKTLKKEPQQTFASQMKGAHLEDS